MSNRLASFAGLGVDLDRSNVHYVTAARLAPQEARLLAVFLGHPNQMLTMERLITAMYPGPDEEPQDAQQSVRVVLSRMRAKLKMFGVELFMSTSQGSGWELHGVRFVPQNIPRPGEG